MQVITNMINHFQSSLNTANILPVRLDHLTSKINQQFDVTAVAVALEHADAWQNFTAWNFLKIEMARTDMHFVSTQHVKLNNLALVSITQIWWGLQSNTRTFSVLTGGKHLQIINWFCIFFHWCLPPIINSPPVWIKSAHHISIHTCKETND